MNDEVHKPTLNMGYCPSGDQAADIFTKFFPQGKRMAWHISRKLINVLSPAEIEEMSGTPGGGWNYKHGNGTTNPVQNASVAVTPDDPLGRLAVAASAEHQSPDRLKAHVCPRKTAQHAEILLDHYPAGESLPGLLRAIMPCVKLHQDSIEKLGKRQVHC